MLTPLSTGVDVAGFDCISFKYRYRYAESVQANDIYIGRWYVDRKAYGEISKKHRRQPRRGCRGRIPINILVGGDINGNVPTNIRGGNVVEYELLIARLQCEKKATLSFKK